MTKSVVLVGSGRLARSLAHALRQSGYTIAQVYSPTLQHAQALAEPLAAGFTNRLGEVKTDADYYVIAVKDDAIPSVVSGLIAARGILIHTSGSTSIDVFKGVAKRYGVLYPLQTFSESLTPLVNVPIFIEGSSAEVVTELEELGKSLSAKVAMLDSAGRLTLHIAAVYACNFVNHLFTIADKLMQTVGLPFELLKPLVELTVTNAFKAKHPVDVQTGPAVRKDLSILKRHTELLAAYPDLQAIYQQLTDNILFYKQRNE